MALGLGSGTRNKPASLSILVEGTCCPLRVTNETRLGRRIQIGSAWSKAAVGPSNLHLVRDVLLPRCHTKAHRTWGGGFSNRSVWVSVIEVRRPRARPRRVQSLARISYPAHCHLLLGSQSAERERESGFSSSYYQDTNPHWELHPHDLISPDFPPKTPSNINTWEVGASTHESGGHSP